MTAASAYRKETHPIWHLFEILGAQGRLGPIPAQLSQPRGAEELYDTVRDPYEIHNLAQAPEYRSMLQKMRRALDNWVKESGDTGPRGDSPELEEFFRRYAEEGMVKRGAKISAVRTQVEAADAAYLQLLRSR